MPSKSMPNRRETSQEHKKGAVATSSPPRARAPSRAPGGSSSRSGPGGRRPPHRMPASVRARGAPDGWPWVGPLIWRVPHLFLHRNLQRLLQASTRDKHTVHMSCTRCDKRDDIFPPCWESALWRAGTRAGVRAGERADERAGGRVGRRARAGGRACPQARMRARANGRAQGRGGAWVMGPTA